MDSHPTTKSDGDTGRFKTFLIRAPIAGFGFLAVAAAAIDGSAPGAMLDPETWCVASVGVIAMLLSWKTPVRILGKLTLLLLATIPLLVVGEVVIGWSGRVKKPPILVTCARTAMYKPHTQYGYSLHPNHSMTYDYPKANPRTLSVFSNSDGFRSQRELGEADERTRVLVVGNSFVFGDGVEPDERFTNVLESKRPEWRVDNLGMTGFGPDLMLMAFEALVLKARPDVVVLCIYTDDLRRVNPYYTGVGFEIPRLTVRNGILRRSHYPRRRLWDRLYTVSAVRKAWWKLNDTERNLNEAILERFLEVGLAQNATVGIVFLPGRSDLPHDQVRRSWLREFSRDHSTPYIDLTDSIHAEGEEAFIEGNWHLNPLGHRVVAQQLVPFVGESLASDTEETAN